MRLNKEINGWLLVLVILVTAGITSWVMLVYIPAQKLKYPYSYPSQYSYSPQQVASNFAPGITAGNLCTSCHPVISTVPNVRPTSTLPHDHRAICSNCHTLANTQKAQALIPMGAAGQMAANSGIPIIRAGAVPPHAVRGACVNCHSVVNNWGKSMPEITATSTAPHEKRGLCSNCHKLTNQRKVNKNPGAIQAAIPMAAVQPLLGVVAPVPTAPLKPVTEGEWMGLEVAPITPLTAKQYQIPDGTQGLVLAEAEGPAAVAGLKAGDVVLSVNEMSIYNMTDFFQATQDGTMTQGVVVVLREGKKLVANITQATNPVTVPVPNTPVNTAPGVAIPMAAVVAPNATAPNTKPATEGEWMGLEVTPITPVTAKQYQIPDGTVGLLLTEVEGAAALAGLKAGDVVLSVNGVSIPNMTVFFQVTKNGTLPQGVVVVLREGKKLAADIAKKTNPATAPIPNTPVNAITGGNMLTPQGGTPLCPGNITGRNGGQGQNLGNVQGVGANTICPQNF